MKQIFNMETEVMLLVLAATFTIAALLLRRARSGLEKKTVTAASPKKRR